MGWAAQEFADLDLGDARLSKRMVKIVEAFARQPTASIPAAYGGRAETQAAYRFPSDQSISWQDMLSPHWKCTQERMRPHAVVLCIQDTT
ncbi:MAG: IS4 family transposase, partial [Xanthomonadales bacterium]|nr:IS4 family transposase [Xanthomonadales bacterium]